MVTRRRATIAHVTKRGERRPSLDNYGGATQEEAPHLWQAIDDTLLDRGAFINRMIVIEHMVDRVILAFFEPPQEKGPLFKAAMLGTFGLRAKWGVIREVLDYTELTERFPDLLRDLGDLIDFRNRLAHDESRIDVSKVDSGELATFRLIRYRRRGEEDMLHVTHEYMGEQVERARRVFEGLSLLSHKLEYGLQAEW